MTARVRYFSLAGIAVFITVFITAAGYTRAVYLSDYVRSFFIRSFNLYEKEGSGVSIISGDKYIPYSRTYVKLPEGFFHFGNSLIYRAPKNITSVARKTHMPNEAVSCCCWRSTYCSSRR